MYEEEDDFEFEDHLEEHSKEVQKKLRYGLLIYHTSIQKLILNIELNIKNTVGSSRDIAQSGDQFFNIFELGADLKLSLPRLLIPFFEKELILEISLHNE